MRYLAIGALLLLTACNQPQVVLPPDTKLPPFPSDLEACFKKTGVDIPKKPLTAGEVEKLWASDRLTIVAKQQCGARAVAWYTSLRNRWR